MVVTDEGIGSDGDSGTSVYRGNTAYGIYHGYCHPHEGTNDRLGGAFSKADHLRSALGVYVITTN